MHLKELDANLIVVLDALLVDASVTKAAERLGRSPSAVSHALANLRHIFSDPLFVRAGQRLAPTAKAKALAPTIHVIVSGMESLLRPTTPFDPFTQERKFSISCRGIFELTLLNNLRNFISEKAPNISLSWKSFHEDHSFEDIRSSKVHFLIKEGGNHEDTSDFRFKKLKNDKYVTIARRDHPLSGKKVALNKFRDHEHIIISNDPNSKGPFQKHLAIEDIKLNNTIEASSAFVGLFLSLQSNALVTLPETVTKILEKHVAFSVIKQPFPILIVPNYLIWHKTYDRDECHEWIRNQIISMSEKQLKNRSIYVD